MSQRLLLNQFKAQKIAELIKATVLTSNLAKPLDIEPRLLNQVRITKQLVWQYVILNPALATQQQGYKHIIRSLFQKYFDAAKSKKSDRNIIPSRFQSAIDEWEKLNSKPMDDRRLARTIADCVASLTDNEAIIAYKRLSGISPGSVLDLLPT
jgi:dGTPase